MRDVVHILIDTQMAVFKPPTSACTQQSLYMLHVGNGRCTGARSWFSRDLGFLEATLQKMCCGVILYMFYGASL